MAESKNKGIQTARLASATARIIRGATVGGVHGAALEAVTAFLPELLKALCFLVAFLFLLPSLAFLCMPSSNYQFPSVDDVQTAQMTEAAVNADGLYAGTVPLIWKEAQEWAESRAGAFDDVAVTVELHGMDHYWMAAIMSARYWQELEKITERELRKVVRKGLSYDTESEFYYVDQRGKEVEPKNDEEAAVLEKRARLLVTAEFAEANTLMRTLKMDDFQREWAGYIHDNIADAQLQNEDFKAEDYGSVRFTDAATPVVFYGQRDVRWAQQAYSASSIGIAGCGPTAMAMVVSTLLKREVTPAEMAVWAEENGHACYGNGSYHSIVPGAAEAYGLTVKRAGAAGMQTIVDALAAGKLVVVIMGPGTFTSSGHFMVLRGVTGEGKVLIADPVSLSRSKREWDLSIILREAKGSAAAGGPFWIISR